LADTSFPDLGKSREFQLQFIALSDQPLATTSRRRLQVSENGLEKKIPLCRQRRHVNHDRSGKEFQSADGRAADEWRDCASGETLKPCAIMINSKFVAGLYDRLPADCLGSAKIVWRSL
jgi:hypothetical protein